MISTTLDSKADQSVNDGVSGGHAGQTSLTEPRVERLSTVDSCLVVQSVQQVNHILELSGLLELPTSYV